jgi:hypothetical protein
MHQLALFISGSSQKFKFEIFKNIWYNGYN